MPKMKRAVEHYREFTTSRGASPTVDRDAGVIRGVKLLGVESANGRTYPVSVIERAAKLYEGSKVNVNHARTQGQPRGYEERIGVVRSVVAKGQDGLFGDFHFNPKHPLAEQLIWDAQHAPENVGFSHDVEAKASRKDGRLLIEEILAVHSVDLVADPATTNGLFEGREPKEGTVKRTIRQILEAAFGDKAKRVLEEDPMAGAAPMEVDAASEGGADENIKAAFRGAVVAAFDDESLDTSQTLAKIKDILKAYEKLTAKAEEKPAEGGAATPPTTEALQAKLDRMIAENEIIKLAAKHGVEVDAVLTEALIPLKADGREAMLKRLGEGKPAPTGGQKPVSKERGAGGGVTEVKDVKEWVGAICE